MLISYVVNAISMNQRSPTTCVDDLDAMDRQLDVLSKVTKGWAPITGYLGALQAQQESNKLQQVIESATTSCAHSSPVSEERTERALRKVHGMVPKAESVFDHVAAKKSDFDSVPLVTPLIKRNMRTMHAKMIALKQSVVNSAAESHRHQLQSYLDRIDAAFERAYGVYGR